MVYLMNENAWFLLHHGICLESSALFNPSIVEDFDQSDLEIGKTNHHILPCHWGGSYFIHYEEQSWIRITIST
jgi:hypothetical protein